MYIEQRRELREHLTEAIRSQAPAMEKVQRLEGNLVHHKQTVVEARRASDGGHEIVWTAKRFAAVAKSDAFGLASHWEHIGPSDV
jgi:hypothetical protein